MRELERRQRRKWRANWRCSPMAVVWSDASLKDCLFYLSLGWSREKRPTWESIGPTDCLTIQFYRNAHMAISRRFAKWQRKSRGNSLAIPFDLCRLVGRPWRHSRLMACIFVLDNQPKGVCCVTHPSLFPLGFRRKMKLQSNENLSPGAAKRVSFPDDGAGIIMRMGLFVKTQCISDGSPLKWKCPSQWVRERQNIGVFQRSRLLRQPICLLLVSND